MLVRLSWSSGESSDSDTCELAPPRAIGKAMPDLVLECRKTEGRWHHEDPRGDGNFTTERKERFRWSGKVYEGR